MVNNHKTPALTTFGAGLATIVGGIAMSSAAGAQEQSPYFGCFTGKTGLVRIVGSQSGAVCTARERQVSLTDPVITWKGEWSRDVAYVVNDIVSYRGASYIAIKGGDFAVPLNALYWNKIAEKGDPGLEGPRGAAGLRGPAGPQGKDGPAGAQGPKGEAGEAGPKGETGAQGAEGAKGAEGLRGSDGPQGAEGPRGIQGPQGERGPDGASGPRGLTGETGPQGPTGAQGAAGAMGLRGSIGPQGPEGPQGPRGFTGETGPAGPEGPAGRSAEPGPVGQYGMSAVVAGEPEVEIFRPKVDRPLVADRRLACMVTASMHLASDSPPEESRAVSSWRIAAIKDKDVDYDRGVNQFLINDRSGSSIHSQLTRSSVFSFEEGENVVFGAALLNAEGWSKSTLEFDVTYLCN